MALLSLTHESRRRPVQGTVINQFSGIIIEYFSLTWHWEQRQPTLLHVFLLFNYFLLRFINLNNLQGYANEGTRSLSSTLLFPFVCTILNNNNNNDNRLAFYLFSGSLYESFALIAKIIIKSRRLSLTLPHSMSGSLRLVLAARLLICISCFWLDGSKFKGIY